jgi:hypothetical protein
MLAQHGLQRSDLVVAAGEDVAHVPGRPGARDAQVDDAVVDKNSGAYLLPAALSLETA